MLPAIANGTEIDRILLARIEPARFRFEVRNAPAVGEAALRVLSQTRHKTCGRAGLGHSVPS